MITLRSYGAVRTYKDADFCLHDQAVSIRTSFMSRKQV